MMRFWPKRVGRSADGVRAKAADTECRADEAKAALQETEKTTERVEKQARLAERLRDGWVRVHERNNLAELFTKDYRGTHG